MAEVIDLLSSDDDCHKAHSEPPNRCRRELGYLQDGEVVPNSERDCKSPGPTFDERGSGDDAGGPGGERFHDSTAGIQAKGNMSNDVMMRKQLESELSSRQFWRAGELYEHEHVHASKRKRAVQGSIEHVRVHPKFLHSNATSHKWALGAIAELLDNSIDEVHNGATYVRVDKTINLRDGSPALLVQDDGGGMSPDAIRKCMSLGYSQKNSNTTIGQYGNGFKTSAMRLGADVIVLTRQPNNNGFVTLSAGLLSYTFLTETGHEDIVVPMVDFKLKLNGVEPSAYIRTNMSDWKSNLATILQWSPFSSEHELLKQFEDIGGHGTKVVVYNLWLNHDDNLELDFDTDKRDIQLRVKSEAKSKQPKFNALLVEEHISKQYRISLRVYSSILYLHMPENFRIILRGETVQHHSIAADLKHTQYIAYKPQIGAGKDSNVLVVTTIGFTKEAPFVNVHGFNVYHKNRLIMPFWKVFHDNSSRGRGVVGVLEANFMEPAHDKQEFEKTAVFLRLENRLKAMTIEYWNLHCHLLGYKPVSKSKPSLKSLPAQCATYSNAGRMDENTSFPSHDDPLVNDVQEKRYVEQQTQNFLVTDNDEVIHPASILTLVPATSDEGLRKKMVRTSIQRVGLDIDNDELEAGDDGLKERGLGEVPAELNQKKRFGQEITLMFQEEGSMTISPDDGASLNGILEHNTILLQKCTDYEMRETHWRLKLMLHEKREQEQDFKIASLEKLLMEHKLKYANVLEIPNESGQKT